MPNIVGHMGFNDYTGDILISDASAFNELEFPEKSVTENCISCGAPYQGESECRYCGTCREKKKPEVKTMGVVPFNVL